jgi:hypothetical protein
MVRWTTSVLKLLTSDLHGGCGDNMIAVLENVVMADQFDAT